MLPIETTDAISSNVWGTRVEGYYEIEVEIQYSSSTTFRASEVGIYVNGARQSKTLVSLVVDPLIAGTYYGSVSLSSDTPLLLSRSDDVQVRAKNGGSAIHTKLRAVRLK